MRWAGHVARIKMRNLVRTQFWFENLKRRDYSEGQGADGRTILKWISGKQGWTVWIGFVWLRIATGDRILWTWKLTLWFQKRWEYLDYSQEGLVFMELSFTRYRVQIRKWFTKTRGKFHNIVWQNIFACICINWGIKSNSDSRFKCKWDRHKSVLTALRRYGQWIC
jgi:hypothetical protein